LKIKTKMKDNIIYVKKQLNGTRIAAKYEEFIFDILITAKAAVSTEKMIEIAKWLLYMRKTEGMEFTNNFLNKKNMSSDVCELAAKSKEEFIKTNAVKKYSVIYKNKR